jgi:hypothetical protein
MVMFGRTLLYKNMYYTYEFCIKYGTRELEITAFIFIMSVKVIIISEVHSSGPRDTLFKKKMVFLKQRT